MDRPEMSARPGADRGHAPQLGGPGGGQGRGSASEDYHGDWVDWVDRLPAAAHRAPAHDVEAEDYAQPQVYARREDYPTEQDAAQYRDEFHGLLDRSRPANPLRRWLVPAAAAVGIALLVGVGVALLGRGEAPGTDGTSGPPDIAAPPIETPGSTCPTQQAGNQIQGNGEGGFDTGPAVIFAFQHAYYVARSAEQVRATTTQDASVETPEAIQNGIDSIPSGTSYCVSVTPGAFAGQYTVVVTEFRPNQPPTPYNPQIVTTIREGGRTLISAIGQG
ncbi:hypothetical protein [Nocardia callitridis]